VQFASNYMPERMNAEIKRRTNVAGIFPNEAAHLRSLLAGLLAGQGAAAIEWQASRPVGVDVQSS
jgi:transposase-like protein